MTICNFDYMYKVLVRQDLLQVKIVRCKGGLESSHFRHVCCSR